MSAAGRREQERVQLAFASSSAAFAVGALVVGTVNVVEPFERGWWLTAYLFLVGGLSQGLLSRGHTALTTRREAPPTGHLWAQWALWNVGTAMVATADMAQVMAGVDIGSVVLLVALALFLSGARRARAGAHRQAAALDART